MSYLSTSFSLDFDFLLKLTAASGLRDFTFEDPEKQTHKKCITEKNIHYKTTKNPKMCLINFLNFDQHKFTMTVTIHFITIK